MMLLRAVRLWSSNQVLLASEIMGTRCHTAVHPRQHGFAAAAQEQPSPCHLAKAALHHALGKRVFRESDMPFMHPEQSKPLLLVSHCWGSNTHLLVYHTHRYAGPQHQAYKV